MSKALFKSTSIVASMTFLSRILGFVRDMVVAQLFGVNAGVDAFNVAFKIPNFMRALFAEGCFSQAFVPVLSEYRQQRDLSEVRLFISQVAGCLASFLFAITVIAILVAPLIVLVFAPGLCPVCRGLP
jgi:putative peptidoglycan lipid II flippase